MTSSGSAQLRTTPPACSQCNSANQVRIEGVWAITRIELLENGKKRFVPTTGVPLIAYVCRRCGHIDLYSAIALGEWPAESKSETEEPTD